MRQIKFRAWDIEAKKMILPTEICRLHFNKGICYGVLLWNGNIVLKFKLLQFTGLKDKNGKEIYEGDILRRSWDFKTPHGTHRYGSEVGDVTSDISGSWCFNNVEGLNPESSTDLWEVNKNCEVIGSIHENPELLKVQE